MVYIVPLALLFYAIFIHLINVYLLHLINLIFLFMSSKKVFCAMAWNICAMDTKVIETGTAFESLGYRTDTLKCIMTLKLTFNFWCIKIYLANN